MWGFCVWRLTYLPGSPNYDDKEFAALLTWAEAYRDRRYPNHIVEWKALNP